MVDVDPGQYRLSAKRNGYLDAYYGARKSSAKGSASTLTAGQKMEDLQIKLAPLSVIAGTIFDSDGEPMGGVDVVVAAVHSHFLDGATTNDLGQYRFSQLPPGKYYVYAYPDREDGATARVEDHTPKSGKEREVVIRTYYPGTPDPSAAGLVELTTGTRATNVDITFIQSPVYKVAVHIDTPAGLKAMASLLSAVDNLGGPGDLRWINQTGDMKIENVPPGNYRLRIGMLQPATSPGREWRKGGLPDRCPVYGGPCGCDGCASHRPGMRGNHRPRHL